MSPSRASGFRHLLLAVTAGVWLGCQQAQPIHLSPAPLAVYDLPDPSPALPSYRIGMLGATTTDNFWASVDVAASVWNAYVMEPTKPSLYTIEYPGTEIRADLAATTAIPQARARRGEWVVTVPIRSEAAWSDGVPITAHDVVFTFETVRDLGLGGGWRHSYPLAGDAGQLGLTRVVAVDSTTIEFWFNEQPGLAIWPHRVGMAPVMPSHHWQAVVKTVALEDDPVAALYGWTGAEDPSGGPMIVTEYSPGSHVHAVANLGYYGRSGGVVSGGVNYERGPFVGDVSFSLYSDQDAAVLALMAGEIDFVMTPLGIAPGLVEQVRSDPLLAAVSNDTNSFRYLAFNLRRFPMNLLEFREALALMVDKEFVAHEVLQGAVLPRYTSIAESNQAWWNPVVAHELAAAYRGRSLEDRLQAAVTLLKRAGFGWDREPAMSRDGTAVLKGSSILHQGAQVRSLEILAPGAGYDPLRATYAGWIETWLEQLGFTAEVKSMDIDLMIRSVYLPVDAELQFDMFVLGWSLGDPSWPTHYEVFWSSRHDTLTSGGHNVTGFSNAHFDDLVDQFGATTDRGDAYSLAWEMERIVAEQKPYLILFDAGITELYRRDLVQYPFVDTLSGLQHLAGMQDLVRGAG